MTAPTKPPTVPPISTARKTLIGVGDTGDANTLGATTSFSIC
jgi:hypothetical protein